MQVSVETLNELERRVTIQVPAEKLTQEIQDRLQSLSRRSKIDGFRPGKAPFKLIKRLYGVQVHHEVVSELVEHSLRDALIQEKLAPLGGPKIEPKSLEEGQDLEYCATFEVMPEFNPAGFENIQVERPVAEVTEHDIDNMLQNLREQRADWREVAHPARQGDRLRLDFDGLIDGQAFNGGKGENVHVILGKNAVLKDFEKHLEGLRVGAETEFDLTFPEDYQAKDVAGKTAHFHVKIHVVEEVVLPEVDDTFAESLDIKGEGVAGLRRSLRQNMERELREGVKAVVKRQVMQGLWDTNSIPLPKILIENEIEQLASQLRFAADAKDEKIQHLKAQLFEREARRRVAFGLLISRVATVQAIKPDEQRIRNYLETLASTYEDPAEVVRWYEQTPQAFENVRALVLEDQVVDWLLEQARVTEKVSTFTEVMASSKQPAESVEQEASE